jgi:hypothetical protein
MSQTAYSLTTAVAVAGMKADSGADYVESHAAQAQINFGLGLVKAQGGDGQVRPPLLNQLMLVLDANLVTGNTFAFTLNGEAVSVLFATSHLATMNAVAAAVEALTGASYDATVGGAGNRTLTVVASNVAVDAASISITGGASQAGVVETRSTIDTIVRGIALHEQRESLIGYPQFSTVNVLRRGKAWVVVCDTVADGDDVYISYADANAGQFRNDNASGLLVSGAKFRSAATTGQIAIVEINEP